MMKKLTLMLAFVSGYCDMVTFFSLHHLFSAHITLNIVVMALDIIKGHHPFSWIKLLIFPIFIFSVLAGKKMASKTINVHTLLFIEGIILLVTALFSFLIAALGLLTNSWYCYLLAVPIIVAMGLQRAFINSNLGFDKTHPINFLKSCFFIAIKTRTGFHQQLLCAGGFFTGCFFGTVAGDQVGLSAVLLPGVFLIFGFLSVDNKIN